MVTYLRRRFAVCTSLTAGQGRHRGLFKLAASLRLRLEGEQASKSFPGGLSAYKLYMIGRHRTDRLDVDGEKIRRRRSMDILHLQGNLVQCPLSLSSMKQIYFLFHVIKDCPSSRSSRGPHFTANAILGGRISTLSLPALPSILPTHIPKDSARHVLGIQASIIP